MRCDMGICDGLKVLGVNTLRIHYSNQKVSFNTQDMSTQRLNFGGWSWNRPHLCAQTLTNQNVFVCVCVFISSSHLCVPDVDTFVKGAAGQVSAIWAKGHAVDGLLVFGQRVDADPSLHVPETHCGVEGGAGGWTKKRGWGNLSIDTVKKTKKRRSRVGFSPG